MTEKRLYSAVGETNLSRGNLVNWIKKRQPSFFGRIIMLLVTKTVTALLGYGERILWREGKYLGN